MRAARVATLACAAALSGACGSGDAQKVQVPVAPSIVFPQGLLDRVQTLHLQVFDTAGGVDCSASTAMTTGIPTGPTSTTTPLADQDLSTTGCASGFKFCGTLTLQKSTTDRVFAAVGKDASGNVLANGCARATVNQDTVAVQIKMVRFITPAMCGNGTVEVGETCDPGMAIDPLCMACQTAEILVSTPASPSYPGGGPTPGNKTQPSFLWSAQAGAAGYFYAFYTDQTVGRPQIAMDVLGDSLGLASSAPMVAQGASLYLPNSPTTFPPQPAPNDQQAAASAAIGGKYYVVFQDDSSGSYDIRLRSMDASLTADQAAPCGINGAGGGGEAGVQQNPTVAVGPMSQLMIVWEDVSSGTIAGRAYTPAMAGGCGTLGTQSQINTSAGASHPVLASLPSGWVVTWQSGSSVKWRLLAGDGTPSNGEQAAGSSSGAQVHPGVASLGDGAFALAWEDDSVPTARAIFAQRFDRTGTPLAGDQSLKVDTTPGDEVTPTIASSAAANGSYVVAWVDAAGPNQVRARLLAGETGSLGDGSGYLFNTIDGQIGDFQVSVTPNDLRASPVVVVGGSAPFIAFGWEDHGSAPGIYARRFPAPSQ